MTRTAKLGQIVYASPGDNFSFTPPKPGRYRFTVGPKHGLLWMSVSNPRTQTEVSNRNYEDYVDAVCDDGEHIVYVFGVKTAYQFQVTRTPSSWRQWVGKWWPSKETDA